MIPFGFCLILNLQEIPSGILRFQILACILYRNIRNSNLILDIFLLIYIKSKIDSGVFSFSKSRVRLQFISFPCSRFQRIRIKLCYKIDFIRCTESTEITAFCISFTLIRCSNNDGGLLYRSCGNASTDNYRTILLIGRIFITRHTSSFGHSQFSFDVFLHHCLIITCMSFFFRNIDAVVEDIVRRHLQFTFYRKSGKVPHVFATATTQLIDDESGTFGKIRGSELHHSIRIGSSGIKISRSQTHALRSYQGIYLTGIITPGALRRETPPPSNQNQ